MTSFARTYRNALMQPALPGVWLVLSGLGVVAGPFGTFEDMAFQQRLIYWPLIVAIGIFLGLGVRIFTQVTLGLNRFCCQAPVIAGLLSILLTPPLCLLNQSVVTVDAPPPDWSLMALYVFLASLGISILRAAIALNAGRGAAVVDGDPDVAVAQGGADIGEVVPIGPRPSPLALVERSPRLFERLEPSARGTLIRLQMRDHYVDVFTTAGASSLLMRFADAIAELDGSDGLRVHRSHWVARPAIHRLLRARGRLQLELEDGTLVPVSRTYQDEVEALDTGAVAPEFATVAAAE